MIYLAGSYKDKDRLKELAGRLIARGHRVTASWVYGMHETAAPEVAAIHDLEELDAASLMILDCTGSKSTGGGRWVELGYALAEGKPVIIMGDRLNVFCHLPKLFRVQDEKGLFKMLEQIQGVA